MTKNTLKQLIRKCINESVNENAFDKIAAKDFADIKNTMKKGPSDMDEASRNQYDAQFDAAEAEKEERNRVAQQALDSLYEIFDTSEILDGSRGLGRVYLTRFKEGERKDFAGYSGISLITIKNFLGMAIIKKTVITITVDHNGKYRLYYGKGASRVPRNESYTIADILTATKEVLGTSLGGR